MTTYAPDDFTRIANAVGLRTDAVHGFANDFEAAAAWHRLDRNASKLMTTSELKRRLQSISVHARKLLKGLGIENPVDAMDGPQDFELLSYLTAPDNIDEGAVTQATTRIGRLVDLITAAAAAANLHQWTEAAIATGLDKRRLFAPPGHQGDIAVNDWIASMMGIYHKLTGKPPGTSVGVLGDQARKARGPLIRFLEAAGVPLGIELSAESWRERVRAIPQQDPEQI